MSTRDFIRRLLIPRPPELEPAVRSGLYHYLRTSDGAFTRFHLRVEPDGQGLLLANATAAARLSPTGVVIAKGLLDDLSEGAIIERLRANFQGASSERMNRDLERVAALIANLATPDDNYPIINLEDPDISPFDSQLMAPLEADISLAAPEKLAPIFERLWEAGVPHVTIFAPEEPDALFLTRAVERAEDLGLIAGVRGLASSLSRPQLLSDLALAGVDHVTLLYASAEAPVHDSLAGPGDHALVEPLFAAIRENEVATMAEIPLVEATLDGLRSTLERLIELDVTNVSFFAVAAPDGMENAEIAGGLQARAMIQAAALVEELAHEMEVRFIWQPPVQRQPDLTLAEQVRLGPRTTGDIAIRVEPDGTVIPARGPFRSAGNLLTDAWTNIWHDDAFLRYRERVERPTRCDDCPELAICAADCPRKPAGWAQGVGDNS